MELYKKYRPTQLKKLVGQKDTVQAIQNMIDNNKVPHTILFTGSSGCGKTTLARIMKTELNCHDHDFKEINCADFRGIDMVRDIRSNMYLAPMGGNCRIWLIDEFHQATNEAQQAMLKILEDTPKHVYFFLATTEPNKLLKTIRTRCTEMPVFDLTDSDIEKLLNRVCKQEEKEIPDDVKNHIVKNAHGSARMALVLLDKVIDLNPDDMIEAIKGEEQQENETIELCRALIAGKDWKDVSKIISGLKDEPEKIRYSVLGYAKAVLLKSGSSKAYAVIDCFRDNFYDSKMAGVVAACYEVVNS